MRLISYALVAISIACARLPSFWYTAAIFWYEVATSAEAPLRVLYITIGHGHFPGGHPDLDIEPDDSRTHHTGVLFFGLWRVYFPPVLIRTDRRLLV
mgnify:CR=1 FL=1